MRPFEAKCCPADANTAVISQLQIIAQVFKVEWLETARIFDMFKFFERFKRKAEPIVLLTERGFVVRQGEAVLREFVWAEIGEVIAYKQDGQQYLLLTLLCFPFGTETDGAADFFSIETEDTAGFVGRIRRRQ